MTMSEVHRVVIVGGGFAGLACARKLAKSQDVRVTLIDRNNFHQFQPLLYQLATAELGTGDVATSLRQALQGHSNVDVKMGEVTTANPRTRTVSTMQGESYEGDFLVLAAGSQANFFQADVKRPGPEFSKLMQADHVYIGRTWKAMPNYVRVTIGTQAEMEKFKVSFKKAYETAPETISKAFLEKPYIPSPSELYRHHDGSDASYLS